jgi:hypothetical protein
VREPGRQGIVSVPQTMDCAQVVLKEKIRQSEHSQDFGLRNPPDPLEQAVAYESRTVWASPVTDYRQGCREAKACFQELLAGPHHRDDDRTVRQVGRDGVVGEIGHAAEQGWENAELGASAGELRELVQLAQVPFGKDIDSGPVVQQDLAVVDPVTVFLQGVEDRILSHIGRDGT